MTWSEARKICENGEPIRRRAWPVTEIDFRWLICQRGLFFEQQYQIGELAVPLGLPSIETAYRFRAAEFLATDWGTFDDYDNVPDPREPDPFEETVVLVVPATACVHVAYAPPGSSVTYDGKTDFSAAIRPTRLEMIEGTEVVTLTATGAARIGPTNALNGPNGEVLTYTTTPPYTSALLNSSGIPAVSLPTCSLIGLWETPSQTGIPFFIGSNLTVIPPAGATALYLGISDSYEWNNNLGSFAVSATMMRT